MEYKLSVIMGVYNCQNTLSQTLDSILLQTFKSFVCYVCDDGSSDNSAAIIKEYAERDSRIVYLQNEKNMGLSATLNRCIHLCNTPYIARMDGDDIAVPERFEKQIEFMESHPEYALCGSSITYFDNNGEWGELLYPEIPEANDFLFVNPYAHPTVMYRAEKLFQMEDEELHTFYTEDKKIGRSEDYDLFMRMHAAGLKGYNFQEKLLLYREDRAAYAKRKFKYAITDARVRYRGFKKLHLLPKGFIYVLKPIIVAMIPKKIRLSLHKKKFSYK